jgi:hypothetical protein
MKKITEFVEHLSLLVAQPQVGQVAMAPKSTTLPESVPKNLMPLDPLWLEATQLSLPLDGGLQMYSSQCLDLPSYPIGENH